METTGVRETRTDLQSDAHDAAANLVRAELALVRTEFRDEIARLETSGIAFGVAAVSGLLGAHALVETFVVSDVVKPWRGLIAGISLLSLAAYAGLFGYRQLPKRALERVAGNPNPGMRVYGG